MRIVIVVRVLWPGGVQRIAFNETKGLIEKGHDVELLFIRGTNRYMYNNYEIPYKVLYPPAINSRPIGRLLGLITNHYSPQRGKDATVDIDLIRKAEKEYLNNFDVVYYFDEFSALFGRYSKKKYGHKVIVLIHEVASNNSSIMSRYVQKKALKLADIILTNTKENLDIPLCILVPG